MTQMLGHANRMVPEAKRLAAREVCGEKDLQSSALPGGQAGLDRPKVPGTGIRFLLKASPS